MAQRTLLELRLWNPEAAPTHPSYGFADILDQEGDTVATVHAEEVDGHITVNVLIQCAPDEITVKTGEDSPRL